jgi:hypothetical protein
MGSDGHCANLLSPRYRHLGVGYYDAPDAKLERVWGQNFGDWSRRRRARAGELTGVTFAERSLSRLRVLTSRGARGHYRCA